MFSETTRVWLYYVISHLSNRARECYYSREPVGLLIDITTLCTSLSFRDIILGHYTFGIRTYDQI